MNPRIVVVIPARYNSSRFPGKPLACIAGQTMLSRVYDIAKAATQNIHHVEVIISTDDERIKTHAESFGAKVVMTSTDCPTGSDRALNACTQLNEIPDIVVNLQGDAPLTPPHFVQSILTALLNDSEIDIATPVVQLDWQELDKLRKQKLRAPFSGTTTILNKQGNALWFSKQIIPAIRKEKQLRQQSLLSPVFRHIGLYGYQFKALKKFVHLPVGEYEALEGLEQLRMLENGFSIKAVQVSYNDLPAMSGVDTPEDLKIAEALIQEHGDLLHA